MEHGSLRERTGRLSASRGLGLGRVLGTLVVSALVSVSGGRAWGQNADDARLGDLVPEACAIAAQAYNTRIDHDRADFEALRTCFEQMLPKLVPGGDNCTEELVTALQNGQVKLVEPRITTPTTEVSGDLAAQVSNARKYWPKQGDEERDGFSYVMDQRALGTVWLYDVTTAKHPFTLSFASGACHGSAIDAIIERSCARGVLANEIGSNKLVYTNDFRDGVVDFTGNYKEDRFFNIYALLEVKGLMVPSRITLPTSNTEWIMFNEGIIRVSLDFYKERRRELVRLGSIKGSCTFSAFK